MFTISLIIVGVFHTIIVASQKNNYNRQFFTFIQGRLGSSSPEGQQQVTGSSQYYATSRQSETTLASAQGMYSSYRPSSVSMGVYAVQRENIFPERPDQPECQYYMKTGDCKFGAVCRFHHPKERLIPVPNCALSPLGLPLRPVSNISKIHFLCWMTSCRAF